MAFLLPGQRKRLAAGALAFQKKQGITTTRPAAASAASPPAAAAAPRKRVDPFSTGGEMQASAQYHAQAAQQIAAIDQSLDSQRADALVKLGVDDATGHHAGTIDRDALQSSTSTTDNAAARGLGRSSIRQGALYDIEAQRVVNTNYVKDALKRAEVAAETNKRIINQGVSDYDAGTIVQQASNAVGVNNTIEPDTAITPPAPSTPGAVPTPKPASTPAVVKQAAQAVSGKQTVAKPGVGLVWGRPNAPRRAALPRVKPPTIGRT